jgi:hypothetical protein
MHRVRGGPSLGGTRALYGWTVAGVRKGPLSGRWLFAWVFLAQLGHLIEHISKAIQGQGLLGAQFDSELSHLLFNGAIGILSIALVLVYPRNPWVYPLLAVAIFHGSEHVYIYDQFLKTGLSDGPGLLGLGGAIGVIPLDRVDLHNVYNGVEMILMVLGFNYETELLLEAPD